MQVPTRTRLAIRATQCAISIVALSLTSSSFRTFGDEYASIQMGSNAVNFGMIATWTSVLYALYQLLAVECFHAVPRPSAKASMATDGIMIVLLAVAGIVMASADTCTRYDAWDEAVRCGNLTAGMVFSFLSAATYFATIVLTAPDDNEGRTDIVYHESATPSAARTEDPAVQV